MRPFPSPFAPRPIPRVVLTITKSGPGSGTVSGPGIDCGTDCTHVYNKGFSVELSATAAAGSVFSGWTGSCTGAGPWNITATFGLESGSVVSNPLALPVATTQTPNTAAYNALNVPALAAGDSYLDPTTGVRIYKLTSATFPTAGQFGGDYAEGGNEISLPISGTTRKIIVALNQGPFGFWMFDFTPGVGVSNGRELIGADFVGTSLAYSFSYTTPYYLYGSRSGAIRRFDVRPAPMTEVTGSGFPVTGESGINTWFHQSGDDDYWVWMRGVDGGSGLVFYRASTGTKLVFTDGNVNEPRIDRGGRYAGFSMTTPQNALKVWDYSTNTVGSLWTKTTQSPFFPIAHHASLRRRWIGVQWNIAEPYQYYRAITDVYDDVTMIGGPANGGLIHGSGNWYQPSAALGDQWAVFSNYGALTPGPNFLAPGGIVLVTENGGRRLLAHHYNTSSTYGDLPFCKLSPDGHFVKFTSNMNGSGRTDVFLAELPVV